LDADLTQIAALSNALGDLLYTNATPEWALLSGNTTTTKKFLRSTGAGGVATAPAWDTVVAADISDLSTGYVTLGTTQDITGQKTFKDCGPIIYGTDQAPSMAFESSLHAFSGGLTCAYLTNDRSWALPNKTGSLALRTDLVGEGGSPATNGTIAAVNLTGKTGDLSVAYTNVILANNYGAGYYNVWVQVIVTTGVALSPVLNMSLGWTSEGGARVEYPIANLSTVTTGKVQQAIYGLYLSSGNLVWSLSGVLTSTVSIRIRCSYLGA
jgi:hypothetical protein